MTNNEYNYFLRSIDELKDADAAFNRSYRKYEITEEQLELYDKLIYQLDEVYIMANMLLSKETYRRDSIKRKREQKTSKQ